ncbi:5-demethoxyubiquinol-8 5-hydroxylase UbiM [Acetobacter conturbans]|uniref:5-demethoxyubiquinol-8 5-hydroxylase UbiM n=1 Tax=Acetobacter conturbans TaxID=1737472 RepID=A0ABX0JX45_9PROT|nr:5-demethoxyubiquinol-8 5-hydroxylase UbiM [Acetobacter conturbans]NHN87328.1 5-demethoxyubiquinol-8 5-hydroxylase UbiM [Acetobacter conturbans]
MSTVPDHDVTIAGGGPVGLAAALALQEAGLSVAVLERAPASVWSEPPFDGREIALTYHARMLLERLGAWKHIPESVICPLREARIETGQHNHPLIFEADRPAGAENAPLGWLVSNNMIRRGLYAEASEKTGIRLIPEAVVDTVRQDGDTAVVHYNGGERARTRLVIGADGRFSPTRRRAGIGAVIHDFERVMMVCRMAHDLPHHNVALQWFGEGQTVALLPVNGHASSLVLTLPAEEIQRLMHAEQGAFNTEIMQRVGNRLGAMRLVSSRHAYPLKCVYAHRFAARRLALLGDAAVGMHPITAHGFNLGLRGAETLASEVNAAFERGQDIGSGDVLRRFERRHRAATMPLFAATNGIATLYTRDAGPFRLLRRVGLRVADALPPFKAAVTAMLMDRPPVMDGGRR